MTTTARLVAIVLIYVIAFIAWEVLGGIITARTSSEAERLTTGVEDLWGHPLSQSDPDVAFGWTTPREVHVAEHTDVVFDPHETKLMPERSELYDRAFALDQRLKGLIWYSLYGVTFDGGAGRLIRAPATSKAAELDAVCLPLPDPARGCSRRLSLLRSTAAISLQHLESGTRGRWSDPS